jgi:hypothetical protein
MFVRGRAKTYIVEHGEEASDNAGSKNGRSPDVSVLENTKWKCSTISTAILDEDEHGQRDDSEHQERNDASTVPRVLGPTPLQSK